MEAIVVIDAQDLEIVIMIGFIFLISGIWLEYLNYFLSEEPP